MIQEAIANTISLTFEILLDPSKISLEIGYPKYDAHYTSTIALAIANRLNLNPLEIAKAIAQTCSQNLEISSQWQIKALGKGWLNIFLSEQYIYQNLFSLDNWQPFEINNNNIAILPDQKLPKIELLSQYAYARCWALIRLANRENLFAEYHLQNLKFIEPIEINLIMQLFDISANLENRNYSILNQYKLSRSLAEAFLEFYDRCRIFGVTREIAISRLLLIRITQKLLLAIAPPEINYSMYL
jgi:arginyl-tRNA synthetase